MKLYVYIVGYTVYQNWSAFFRPAWGAIHPWIVLRGLTTLEQTEVCYIKKDMTLCYRVFRNAIDVAYILGSTF